MLDAGVPLKHNIAGVAMGLILNSSELDGDGEPVILSDIIGAEDALGDMDFKVLQYLSRQEYYLLKFRCHDLVCFTLRIVINKTLKSHNEMIESVLFVASPHIRYWKLTVYVLHIRLLEVRRASRLSRWI